MQVIKGDTRIWGDISTLNINRIRYFSIVSLFLMLLLIMIDSKNRNVGLWGSNPAYKLLFYLHISFALLMIYGIFIKYLVKNIKNHDIWLLIYIFILLDLSALTSGWVDQYIHGEITVFIMLTLIVSVVFYIRPLYAILLYLQSYILLISCLFLTKGNGDKFQGHLINSTSAIFIAVFISILIYHYTEKEYYNRYNLENLIKERTRELSESNRQLELEIEEREKMHIEFNRLDRLNLIAEMSASIAHEIRNPMTTIKGFLQLLKVKQVDLKHIEYFDLMIDEVDRANSIISEFLSLARIKQSKLKSQSLNDILNNLYPLLEADAFTHNKQICFVQGKIPNLNLNGNEISQLVLNLARNGLEAMEERGSLTIKTYMDEDDVILEIMDEGCGIPPENLSKLGVPFFTTKDYGTGLGLATSYKIAQSHNAKIRINSSSSGTSFCLIFPIPGKEEKADGMIA